MQLGMIGLGRMGANIVRRLMRDGHECVVYDVNADAVADAGGARARSGAASLEEFASKLDRAARGLDHGPGGIRRRPADRELAELLEADDIIIDGGNSYYRDDIDRAARARARRASTTSTSAPAAASSGLERGYCMMIGGEAERRPSASTRSSRTIAPGVEAAERTPGRTGEPAQPEHGYLHCGPPGAGHFVKMVHNGIEYGMMAAYAEGMAILRQAERRLRGAGRTTPRPRRCATRSTTATRSTRPRSPRSGGAAA